MSTVDEVLATAEVVDAVCVIDGETRIISVPNEYKELGVESDEKVTRVKFQCPKIVGDNIDLTEYNLYINYRNAGNKLNSYLVEDATVTDDIINFSWLLSRHVTESPGTISYIVCAKKSDDTGVINEWNTKVATGTVGVGLEATQEIEEQNIDVIEQILKSIVDLENNSGGSAVTIDTTLSVSGQAADAKSTGDAINLLSGEISAIPSGADGGYYSPSVDADGNLSWTASKDDMPAVDGANIKGSAGQKGDTGATGATGPAGANGKSAYAYAVEGGYTGTEAEFAAKLAQEKYANPEALTFTGAAAGSYDGSQPLTVNIPSGAGGDNPWRLIKTVTLEETVKSITVDTDSDGNAFSLSEIYINTNVTNSEDQTVATSFSLKINGKYTHGIGTTAGMAVPCGKTGESGRNWIWLMSLNPLRALHGIWMATNTASGKTVQCYQANEFSDTNPNPHSVGEKITGIEIFGLSSTNYLAAGSEFRIYGR